MSFTIGSLIPLPIISIWDFTTTLIFSSSTEKTPTFYPSCLLVCEKSFGADSGEGISCSDGTRERVGRISLLIFSNETPICNLQ